MIRKNTHAFHVAFSQHDFARNGTLVSEDVHVNGNGVELNGRDAFVKQISRFVGPFPDVKIDDQITLVDGNRAAIASWLPGLTKAICRRPTECYMRRTERFTSMAPSSLLSIGRASSST